jgi:chromobox protein 1
VHRENATEILSDYLESIGGRDKIFEETDEAQKSKKRGRPAGAGTPANGGKRSKRGSHPGSETPPASAGAKKSWKPPAGSWEEHVASIDACHDENTGKLVVYLTWKNGNKTQHGTETIYTRCPQQMLRFYERHVKIVKTTSDHEAETAAAEAAAEQTKAE